MINLMFIGDDVCLTNALLKNISKQNLSNCPPSYRKEIAKMLKIKEVDIQFLNQENFELYNNLPLKKRKRKLLSISFDETQELPPKALMSLDDLIKNSLTEKKRRISEELEEIGYSFKYKGTEYIMEAILELRNKDLLSLGNLQTTLYPLIAKRHNKTVHNVKNCIITATDNMYCECDIEKLKTYFHLCEDEKPSIKRIIYTIASRVYR